jgi:hypothetical protein
MSAEDQVMRRISMWVLSLAALAFLGSKAIAQGTTSTNRPAGTDFSVTTGVGSSSSVTTHKAEPGPPLGGSPIYGIYQSLPEEKEGKPDEGNIDQAKPVESGAQPRPSSPEGPNAIARDRIESPQDK